nr:TPA_asm: hypothetical protein HUJ06_003695 [Nelumbo nucifera]
MNARIHDLVLSLWENDRIMLKEDFSSLSENTRHLSLLCDHFSDSTFDALGLSCSGLRSLLFLRGNQGAYFPDKLSPNYLYLRVLDLSHTKLDRKFTFATGGLRFLCYLDLSESSIGWLDGDFHELQTLRLLRCYSLCKFSIHVNSPVNLRHLQIDTSYSHKLTKMPEKIGELTCLQTLPFFFASRETGYRVGELKKLTELRGELGIFQLENVHSLEEAEEAMLQNKQHLNKLILQWNGESKQYGLEDVLEGLRPHENLKELEIVSYDGLLFPSWLGNPLYSNLISISLKCCRKCQFLPPLGQLPHLRFLKISSLEEVKHVGYEFYRGDSVKGFLSLEKLEFEGMSKLEKWDDFEQGEFPILRELDVISCPKLRHLPDLKYLMCLQNLRIEHCSDLESLPREALPTSLESLTVKECPKVKVVPKQRGVKSLMKTYPGDLARNNFSSYIHNRINNIQKELDELREITQNLEINFDDGGTV